MNQFTSEFIFDSQLQDANLESTENLLQFFLNSTTHKGKICALAKIKYQIQCSPTDEVRSLLDEDSKKTIQILFSKVLLKYLKKNHVSSIETEAETKLFFHVVSLTIKHFFSEEGFKELLMQVTDLVDRYSHRTQLALKFFTEIIYTIEDNRGQQGPRCQFERHFVNQHISSMLTLANFFLQQGLLTENTSIQDGHVEEIFEIVASEEYIIAAIQLIRACLCFDWQGQKFNQFQEVWEMGCLLIPTKRTRQPSQSQFEKWLKASEWIRLYSFLFKEVHSKELKIEIVQLLGDLARVHMKFFRNKNYYRIYIQNIVLAFSQILECVQIRKNSQQQIQISLSFLVSLNKLITGSSASMLFEVNQNFFKGLLSNLKHFIIYQMIGENTLNSNLIYYSFKFYEELLKKSRFERNKAHFETIEEVLRDICRSYQQFFRILMNNIRKKPIKIGQTIQYRMDYSQLRDHLAFYDYNELQIYFLPFRLMKPRYATNNSIHEVFIYICAKVIRAMSVLQFFKLEKWEVEMAHGMVSQSVITLADKFGFTSYKKNAIRKKQELLNDSHLSPLPPISQHYQEQIDNEEQYCHMLRLALFIIIDQIINVSLESTLALQATIIKMVSLTVELCLCADLQDKGSSEWDSQACRQKVQRLFEKLPLLCRKVYLRQYQKSLYILQQTHQLLKLQPIRKRYTYTQASLELKNNDLQSEAIALLQIIDRLLPHNDSHFHSILIEIKVLTLISLETYLPRIPDDILSSIENCIHCVDVIMSEGNIASLVHYKQKRITDFLHKIVTYLDTTQANDSNLVSIMILLRKLVETQCGSVREEALNKIFVMLKCLLPFLRESEAISDELFRELELMRDQVLCKTQQKDLQQLAQSLNQLLLSKKEPERMELQTTCLSFHGDESVGVSQNVTICSKQSYFPQLSTTNFNNQFQQEQVNEQENIQIAKKEQQSLGEVVEIYDGFHRDKTMEILNKYIEDTPKSPPKEPSPVKNHEDQEKGFCETPNRQSTYQIDADTQFPEEPMEIEGPHPHDYVQIIKDIIQHQHTFQISKQEAFQKKQVSENEDTEEDIYIPLEPEETIPEETQNQIEKEPQSNYLSVIEEKQSIVSSQLTDILQSPKKCLQFRQSNLTVTEMPSAQKKGFQQVQQASEDNTLELPNQVSLIQKQSSDFGETEKKEKRSLLLIQSSSGKKEKEES